MQTILLKNAHQWVDAPLRERIFNTSMIFFGALALRTALHSALESYLSVQFFLFGALLVSNLYGYVPALTCLLVGWVVGLFFFVVPYGEVSPISKFDVVLSLNYFVTGLLGIAGFEYLQRVRCSTRLMLAVSESRYRSLLRLDNHRLHQQRQSTRALRQVSDIFLNLDRALLLVNQDNKVFPLSLLTDITGQSVEGKEENWLLIVHVDDRLRVEDEIATVISGKRESLDVRFRLSAEGGRFTEIECVFRTLTLTAHKHVFALLLKPSPRS